MRTHPTPRGIVRLIVASLLLVSAPLFAQESTISLGNAVFKTLEANPLVHIEKERIKQSEGRLQTASGQFDWVAFTSVSREREKLPISYREQQLQKSNQDAKNLQTRQNEQVLNTLRIPYTPSPPDTTPIPEETRETTTTYSLGLSRQLRSGIQITPSISNLDYKNNTDQTDGISRSDLDMEIVIPLMRGLGENITGAEELAARSNLGATEFSAKHSVSERIYATASSYWNCLAAQSTLRLLEDTEKRAKEIYDLVERLVRAGDLEPAIMHQARAQLYQRQGDLTSSRLRLYEARLALALAMGLPPREMADAPLPEGPFPPAVGPGPFEKGTHEVYLREAMNRRGDFLAAKTSVETELILLEKARNDTKPRLDLTLKAGYAGLDESDNADRYYNSVSNNLTGLNAYAGIRLELPIFNDAAQGEVVRRHAAMREADLAVLQLSNRLASEILVAMERVQNALQEYRVATQSSESYRDAAKHENYKVKMGESSLADLIDIEDKYYQARINQLEAMRKYSVSLAELRLVTGTLLSEEKSDYRFRVDTLLTLPPTDHSKQPEG